MRKKRDVFNVTLDQEEQELLESVERGEWQTATNAKEEAVFAREAAENSLSSN